MLFVDCPPAIKEHGEMKLHHRLIALVCVGACSPVFAADPPAASPPAATATAPADQTSAKAPAAATSTAATSADKAKEGPTDAEIKAMRSQGYKPHTQNGVTVYCRSERQIGSNFEKQTCGSASDIATLTNQSKDTLTNAQKFSTFNPKGN
jgi:hypothetical protein